MAGQRSGTPVVGHSALPVEKSHDGAPNLVRNANVKALAARYRAKRNGLDQTHASKPPRGFAAFSSLSSSRCSGATRPAERYDAKFFGESSGEVYV
jgi:hypothetical protein